MNIFWALIMGLIQGLTEFFPVSSSAHLALLPWVFKYADPGLAFDIALHAGAMLAILVAFRSDWIKLIQGVLNRDKQNLKLAGFLLLTSIPGAIFGVLLEKKAETVFRTPLLIAATLVIFGLVLLWVDKKSPHARAQEKMGPKDAILIGLSQAMAIIPGVSRSGATVTAGRALGFTRPAAVKYSFMAALPIIAGATVFGLRHVSVSTFISPVWIVGFLAAFGSSIWAMGFLLRYVKENDFRLFVWWRFALATLILILIIVRR